MRGTAVRSGTASYGSAFNSFLFIIFRSIEPINVPLVPFCVRFTPFYILVFFYPLSPLFLPFFLSFSSFPFSASTGHKREKIAFRGKLFALVGATNERIRRFYGEICTMNSFVMHSLDHSSFVCFSLDHSRRHLYSIQQLVPYRYRGTSNCTLSTSSRDYHICDEKKSK